jgi:hypothetical protein
VTAVLRCERVSAGDLDGGLAELRSATLARTPAGSFIAVSDDRCAEAIRVLAFAGVRARPDNVSLDPPRGTRAAIGRDLTSLPLSAVALDVVQMRALALGSEARRLVRRSPWQRPSESRQALCRDLLQGANAQFGWRRRAWATREILRDAGTRRVLRPIVFDVGALGAPPEHRALARDGHLGAWLFG